MKFNSYFCLCHRSVDLKSEFSDLDAKFTVKVEDTYHELKNGKLFRMKKWLYKQISIMQMEKLV